MRAVLDTNVLISTVLSHGSSPDSILRAWRTGSFELVISTPLLREFEKVLARPRIRRRLRWSTDERTIFVAALSEGALVVTPEEELRVIQADVADNRVQRPRCGLRRTTSCPATDTSLSSRVMKAFTS